MKGAFIDAGGAAQRALSAPGQPFSRLHMVEIERLAMTNLEAFDLVVVPRSCDGDALYARRHQFARFLDSGGVLIALGELWTNWLPGTRWEQESPEDTRPPAFVAPHRLLGELGAEDLWWHKDPGGWCCHGHVRVADGVERLVATPDGGSWLHIDRVSTRGTIVVASNLDLDTHAYNGSEIARTLLERLMAWAEGEVGTIAARRTRRGDRIAGYFSGVFFQHGFFSNREQFAMVPAPELSALDLERYPALWIPRESDQRTLEANAQRIAAYVKGGGKLVSLESIDRPWLPGASWAPRAIDIGRARRANHPLVTALGKLERPWHAHGALQVPLDAEVLISEPDGGVLLAIYPFGRGSVLVSTLDPDSHAGYGSSIPQPFIDEIVTWTRAPVPLPVS
jgi:hypothetical protein